jgi:hypothetical protein
MAVSLDLFDELLNKLEEAKELQVRKALTCNTTPAVVTELKTVKGIQIAIEIVHKVTRKDINKLDIDLSTLFDKGS